jgi:hypothetical protein
MSMWLVRRIDPGRRVIGSVTGDVIAARTRSDTTLLLPESDIVVNNR